MDDKNVNEEDDKYIETPSEENYIIKLNISEGILEEDVRNSLSAKTFSRKVIKVVMFTIENHERDKLAVGYQNKKNQTQDRRNHLNPMQIQSLFVSNHCLPLSHMSKHYIWLEETNERINEFSIGYTMNTSLSIDKSFT